MLLAKDSDMKIDQRILALVDDSLIVRLNSQDAAVDVDDQNDFGSREGSLYVQGAEETRPASISFLRRFPVNRRFTSGDDHLENDCSFLDHGGNWPPHCVRGTKGVELVPGLKELPVKKYIKKGGTGKIASYGAVHDDAGNSNGLNEVLKEQGVKRVFVFRLAFDFCVGETAVQLAEAGYEVYLVVDLTCAIGITLTYAPYIGRNSIEVMIERLVAAGVKFVFSSQVV